MTRAQFQTVALCGSALAAGVLLGFFIAPRLRDQSSSLAILERPPAAQAKAANSDPGEREALRQEIEGLEQELARPAAKPADEAERLRALLSRLPGLKASGDAEGLLALMQELAAMGEPGYPAALEIAAILGDEENPLLEIDSNDSDFRRIFTPAMLEMAAWVLRHPKGIPESLLQLALDALHECGECDLAGPLLEYLSKGESHRLNFEACLWLEEIAVPSMAPGIADTIRLQAKRGQSTWDLCGILARLGSEGALRELEALAASQDPVVSADARDALNVLRPAAGREAVTASGKNWGATRPVGTQWGDVVVSFEGTTLTSLDQLPALYAAAPRNVPQVLTVERRGRLRRISMTFSEGSVTFHEEDK